MTGVSVTWVSDPQGAVNSGVGDQYNVTLVIGANAHLFRADINRLEIAREHRNRLARCFVRPRGYRQAADRLARPGAVVLLDGASGVGRRSAATMLLEEAPVSRGRVEELPWIAETGTLHTSPDDRYLLDLSSVTHAEYPAAQETLIRYRSLIEQSGARMVVVPPVSLGRRLDADLFPLVVFLERPRGQTVFCRHLRFLGVHFQPEELNTGALAHLFAVAPLRELARLAQLVAQARDSHSHGTTFVSWRDEAVAAATNWSDEVSRQLRQHRTVPERALLLTAAMTSGATAESVQRATHLLLEVLQYPQDDMPRLAQADLGEQLEGLSVVREDDGRVRFPRLAYDNAVRRHFWENFPDLRPAFRDWVGRCVELPGLRAGDRVRLVLRFAEEALSAGRPDDLCELIEKWTRPSAVGRLRAEAAAALELGLSHDQHGSRFRSRVYGWVTATRIAPDLARVVTDVCQQVMAVTHPEQAMVRLRHLALRQDSSESTAGAARAALLELVRSNGRLYSRLVQRLVQQRRSTGSAADLLLAMLEPGDLRVTPPWPEVTLAWRAVMLTKPRTVWTPVVRRWLATIARQRAGERVLSALLLATSGDRALLNHLYVTSCDWADLSPDDMSAETRVGRVERARIADRFCREIDLLQGVGEVPSGSGTQGTREGP